MQANPSWDREGLGAKDLPRVKLCGELPLQQVDDAADRPVLRLRRLAFEDAGEGRRVDPRVFREALEWAVEPVVGDLLEVEGNLVGGCYHLDLQVGLW